MTLRKRMKKIKTNYEPVNDGDVINKNYLNEKLRKIDGHISFIENDYNELDLQYKNESVEEILIQRAVKTTVQILYDKELFDKYANADKVLENFLFVTRRRGDLSEQVNDDIQ